MCLRAGPQAALCTASPESQLAAVKEREQIHSHPIWGSNLFSLDVRTSSIVLGSGKGREEIEMSVAYNLGSL